jgi:hypothetical protein
MDFKLVKQLKEADIFRGAGKRDLERCMKTAPHEALLERAQEYTSVVERMHEAVEEADSIQSEIANFEGPLPPAFEKLFIRKVNTAGSKIAEAMYALEELKDDMNNWISDAEFGEDV